MKVNKIFGVKSITNLIYGVLLLLPMIAVVSRVIYTQSNPNAKDSYYGETINETRTFNVNSANLQTNHEYTFNSVSSISYVETTTFTLEVRDFKRTYPVLNSTSADRVNRVIFRNQNNNVYVFLYENNTYISDTSLTTAYVNMEFTLINKIGSLNSTYEFFTEVEYNKFSYLDNVFEYSIDTFLHDYDNQGVDFFSWFTNLFLNQSNQHNALYLNFCNWYMNYVLLVSSAYLLFFALMWFINYVRKILEKSSYHDFGGF